MKTLDSQNILLTGLPGSGKSHVALALKNQFACPTLSEGDFLLEKKPIQFAQPGCYEWQDFIALPANHPSYFVWCVIDIRSILPDEDSAWLNTQLRNLVRKSDGIVFTFSENSSLDNQAWWSKWIAKNRIQNKPLAVTRMLNQSLPADFNGFAKASDTEVDVIESQCVVSDVSERIESFHFELDRVVLDHLLMVLDNARHNLGMNITRVEGVLKTLEYQNLVAIEGTPYRWDTYAADSDTRLGELTISGMHLEQAWLSEVINACKV